MSASIPGLTLAGEPRVQLLPPSVKEREKSRAARRMMGLLVVLAIVIAGAGTGGAFWLTTQAETRLADAQQRTLDILAQQAEYSAGAQVAAQVAATEDARRLVTANEVDWLKLATDVMSYITCACSSAEIAVSGPAPWEPALIPEGPLRSQRVASMTLLLTSPTYADAAAFVSAVREMEGVEDAFITTSTLDGESYDTQIVLTFDASVLALRYAPIDQDPPDDADTDDEAIQAGATPAPDPTEGVVP